MGLLTVMDKPAEENAKSELRFADGSTTVAPQTTDDFKEEVVAALVLPGPPS